MRLSLRTLPVELQLLIVEDLIEMGCKTALFEWSRTCSYFRHILVPYLFRSATFINTEERVSDLLSFSDNYGHLIESLIFRTSFPDRCDNTDVLEQIANIFPAGALELLAVLRRFPHLKELTIDLPLTFHALVAHEDFWDQIDYPGSWARRFRPHVHLVEQPQVWRTVTAKTYEVLSSSMKDRITSLQIKNLKPRDASGFRSKAFQELLRQLQRFELSIFGPDSQLLRMLGNQEQVMKYQRRIVEDYAINGLDCFEAFEDSFDVLFFNHLENVTEIALCGHHLGQLGRVTSDDHRHLALKSSQMPFLRSIYLSQYFFSSELIAFLLGHSGTLEAITLHDCMPDPYFMDTRMVPYIYWCDLFRALSDGKMKRLREFIVTPLDQRRELPWPDDRQQMPYEGPNTRIFGYCFVGDLGQTCEDYEHEFQSHMLGEDQRAYDKLMKFVRKNKRTLRKPDPKESN